MSFLKRLFLYFAKFFGTIYFILSLAEFQKIIEGSLHSHSITYMPYEEKLLFNLFQFLAEIPAPDPSLITAYCELQ